MKTKQEPKKENSKKRNRKKAEDKMKALTLKLMADGLIPKRNGPELERGSKWI